MIVNHALVQQYFPNEDPIGQQLLYGSTSTQSPMEIVGIVDDIKEGPLDGATAPTMYVSFAQDPTSGFAVVARTSQSEASVLPAIAAAIHEMIPGITTFQSTSMAEAVKATPSAYLRRSSAVWWVRSPRSRGYWGSSGSTG